MTNKNNRSEFAVLRVEIITIFVFLNSMGFPGTYCRIFGNSLDTVISYGAFILEIAVMLLMSGNSFLDIRIIDLKEKYIPIYQFLVIVFVESMIVTSSVSEQIITCLRLSVTILYAIWLVEHFSLERVIELFCYAQVLLDISVVVLAVIKPELAFMSGETYFHALCGIFEAKNTFASELALGFVMIFLNIISKKDQRASRIRWIFFLIIHFVLLIMAQAKGALVTCVIVALYRIVFCEKEKYRVSLGWWYIGISIGFLLVAFTILPLFEPLFNMLGKDATLTGRTILWNGIYEFIQKNNMLTGFGYGHFWFDSKAVARLHSYFTENSFFNTMTTGAHNQIMELWLNTGLIGICSYLAMIVLSMNNCKTLSQEKYRAASCILLYLTIYGLTERIITGGFSCRSFCLFIMMAIGCSEKNGLEKSNDISVNDGGSQEISTEIPSSS